MGRIIAIDYGLARIGVARSDLTKTISSIVGQIKAKKQLQETVADLLHFLAPYKEEIELIIIGNPLHLNGKSGPMAQAVALFKEQLEAQSGYKVLLWDERLSTMQAERALREGDMNRKKRAQVIDSLSAVVLLQSYLDSLVLASNC